MSVQASGELKVERTPTTLDANGCPWQNLSIQTTLKLSANAEAKGAKAGGSLAGYLGQSTKFQLTVSPDAADEIADGDRPPPNPVDPSTIAAGESIQLSEDFYNGVNAKASYRALQVELGYGDDERPTARSTASRPPATATSASRSRARRTPTATRSAPPRAQLRRGARVDPAAAGGPSRRAADHQRSKLLTASAKTSV